MKKLNKIFALIFLLFEFVVSQCLGDFNLNYQVEQTDLNIFSNYLLLSNDTIINNADIDYNNSATLCLWHSSSATRIMGEIYMDLVIGLIVFFMFYIVEVLV